MSETPEAEYPDVEAQNVEEGQPLPDPDHPDWQPDLPEGEEADADS